MPTRSGCRNHYCTADGRPCASPCDDARIIDARLARPRVPAPALRHERPRDFLLTLAIVALCGFSFVPIKVGMREVPPFALAALRFLFAAVPLVFFVARPQIPWRFVAGYGVAIGICQFGLRHEIGARTREIGV